MLSLLAAVLLGFAAFLPLFIGDSDFPGAESGSTFSAGMNGWNSGFGLGYQLLAGAAVAVAAGVVAAWGSRKGGLVLLIASAAFNLGVGSIAGSALVTYAKLFPEFDGPEGRITADLGVGVWFLCAGLLLAFAAVALVLTPADLDLANRRWGMAATLSLVAAALLTLAAFLPHFSTEWGEPWGDGGRITANAWGITQTIGALPGRGMPYGPEFSSGYQQLFGAALALAAGLLALVAARKSARGRSGSMVMLVAAGSFNLGFAPLLVEMLSHYFTMFPAQSRSLRLFDVGLGIWCLFLGVLFALLATVAVLSRKPAEETLPATTGA
ncbi:hypothetical protein DMH04_45500 [Kibdelosporangium aridum]|uniref:Uncharacterized protein n=1 Tax=Kibdelosporangium aridum TaxID=2030 RepID=A0A428YN86_KIBAR|nr:hypothetical protein DMH04_45500 [Kibdelosporangium aridum]